MTPLTGVVRNGKIEVAAPSGLSDGTEVVLLLVRGDQHEGDDAPLPPEEIEQTLRAMDQFEAQFPVDEEGEDLSHHARESAAWEKSNFEARVEKLRRMVD